MRGWRRWTAGFFFFGWTASWAAGVPDRSMQEILDRLRNSPPSLSGLEDRASLWRALVGPAPLPVRCGTPVAAALGERRSSLSPALRAGVDRLLQPPPSSRRLAVAEGYELRASAPIREDLADENGNGVADVFDRAFDETSRALRLWTENLGWLPPAGRPSGSAVRIILADLPPDLDAMALADGEPERTFEEDATATVVMSRTLVDRPDEFARVLVHQMAHAVLWAYSHREEPAWQEASAVALEIEARRDAHPYLGSFAERLQQRGVSLRSDRLGLAQGGGLWALFLDLSHPAHDSALRRLWEELAAVPRANLTEAAETVFTRLEGPDAGAEIATYLAWGLFTGERDDGRHFPFAGALRAVPADAQHAEYPADGPPPGLSLEPWSGAVVRLETGRDPGGLRVEFHGEERGRWSVLALFEGREAGALRSTFVPVDAEGRASLRFPWRALAAVTLIVVNAAAPGTGGAHFSYSIGHDPSYPFDLAGLEAEPTRDGVALRWTTDGEQDLAGWNIYRSASALRDFERVNQLPIPAGGDVRDPLHYLFLDSDAAPGRKYYYYVEGLTAAGFAERSHSVSARTPAAARQR
jgi:hypothetical protein